MARQKAVQCIYGPLKGRTVHFTDRKQDLRPAWSTIQKAAQTAPRGGFPMYFLLYFMVLLRQLQRLYTSGSIFQVPPVYNYSTCCTNRVLTRSIRRVRVYAFSVPTCLRLWYTPETLASQGGVRQYIDYVAYLNRIDSYRRLNKHTILYVFRAPRHDSLLFNWYQQINTSLKSYSLTIYATNYFLLSIPLNVFILYLKKF